MAREVQKEEGKRIVCFEEAGEARFYSSMVRPRGMGGRTVEVVLQVGKGQGEDAGRSATSGRASWCFLLGEWGQGKDEVTRYTMLCVTMVAMPIMGCSQATGTSWLGPCGAPIGSGRAWL